MMERFGGGQVGVLLIPPMMERNAKTIINQLHKGQQFYFTFYTVSPVPYHNATGLVDHKTLLEKCREIIKTEGIKILYANKSVAMMVMAALCEEFSHLRGPSVESVFLCNHKFYSSVHIDSREDGLPFTAENVYGDIYDIAYELLNRFKVSPAVVRFPLGSGHTVYKYSNRDQLLKVLLHCQSTIDHVVDAQRWLINNHIDCKKYPLATKPVMLIQPYLDRCIAPNNFTWRNVSIEACVCQKEIIPWAICDGVTLPYDSPNPTRYFCGSEMPTKLTILQQDYLWKAFKDDIRSLIEKGFNNAFLHAEYMVFENGNVHLITMNSRLHAKCVHMYKYALVQGNNVKAALDLARGMRPRTPVPSGKYVLNYSLVAFSSGKVNDMVKFSKAKQNPFVHLNYMTGEELVVGPAQDFVVFGCITVPGENFADCILDIKKIRNEILKHPEKVPFTE